MKNLSQIKSISLIAFFTLLFSFIISNSSFASCNINAGGDTTYCFDSNPINLYGSASGIDLTTINWSIISAPLGVSASITSTSSLVTNFTRTPSNSTGTFLFAISGDCLSNGTTKIDTVIITITPPSTIAQIYDTNGILLGDTITVCTRLYLQGNTPGVDETGFWSSQPGVVVNDNGNGRLSSYLSPSINCKYQNYFYTISNGGCSSTKKIVVKFERGDEPRIQGYDTVNVCGDTINIIGSAFGCNGFSSWNIIPQSGIPTPNSLIRLGGRGLRVYFTQSGSYQIIYNVTSGGVCPSGSDTTIYNVCLSSIGTDIYESILVCDSFPDTVFLTNLFNPSYTYGNWKNSSVAGTPPAQIIQTSPGQGYALIFDHTLDKYIFSAKIDSSSCSFPNGSQINCQQHKTVRVEKIIRPKFEKDTLFILCQKPGQFFKPNDYIASVGSFGNLRLLSKEVPLGCTKIRTGRIYNASSELDFSCDGTYRFSVISYSPCNDTAEWVVIVASLQNPSAGSDSYIKLCENDTVPLVGSLPYDANGNINPNVTGLWTQVDGNPPVTFLGNRNSKDVDITNFSVIGTYMFVYSFSLDSNCYLADTMFVFVDSCKCPEYQIKTKCEFDDSTGRDSLIFFSSPIGIIWPPGPVDSCDLCHYRIDSISIVITDENDSLVDTSQYIINWSHDSLNHTNTSFIRADEEIIVTVSGPDSCIWTDTILYLCDTCKAELPSFIGCGTNQTGRNIFWSTASIYGNTLSKFAEYEIEIIWNDPSCCSGIGIVYSQIFKTKGHRFDIPGLGSCFSYRIRTICEDGTVSPWSTKRCSCDPPCNLTVPTNLKCDQNFFGFQKLSWDLVPGATYIIAITMNDPDCCPDNGNLPYSMSYLSNDPFLLMNLTDCFSWKVQAVCPDGTTSGWSQTKCSCGPICEPVIPTNLYCSTSSMGQHLWWDPVPGATYEIYITWNDPACCAEGIHLPYVQLFTTSNPSYVINSLSSCFSWKVRSVCPDGTKSQWSITECSCGVIPECSPITPTNLNCSGGMLSWNNIPGASYEIDVSWNDPACCFISAPGYSEIFISSNPNLVISRSGCYSWRVRSKCPDGSVSPWSTVACGCSSRSLGGGSGITGVEENNINQKSVLTVITSPNPASDFITFNLNSNFEELTGTLSITNLAGQLIYTSNVPLNGLKVIDLSSFSKGAYIYTIRYAGGINSGRIIKSN